MSQGIPERLPSLACLPEVGEVNAAEEVGARGIRLKVTQVPKVELDGEPIPVVGDVLRGVIQVPRRDPGAEPLPLLPAVVLGGSRGLPEGHSPPPGRGRRDARPVRAERGEWSAAGPSP